MRRYERASTSKLTSNRPVEDWGKLLAIDSAAVTAMLDSLAASRTRSQVRTAQLAHQNRQYTGDAQWTKPKRKGGRAKERPASFATFRDPEASTTEPHHRNTGKPKLPRRPGLSG